MSVYYDPMIAKLVVWDRDRDAALAALRYYLDRVQVVGPSTNVKFLKDLASHPAFIRGEVETGFIQVGAARTGQSVALGGARGRLAHARCLLGEGASARFQEYAKDLLGPAPLATPEAIVQAALSIVLRDQEATRAQAARAEDANSPTWTVGAQRLNGVFTESFLLKESSRTLRVEVQHNRDGTFDVQVHRRGDVTRKRRAPVLPLTAVFFFGVPRLRCARSAVRPLSARTRSPRLSACWVA